MLTAAAAAMLTGCATTSVEVSGGVPPTEDVVVAAPAPVPTPSPSSEPSVVLGEEVLSGVGPRMEERLDLSVPSGTQSVHIDLTCDPGERFTAELGDAMMLGQAMLSGACEDARTLAWPWTESSSHLALWVEPNVEWTASVTYSSETFEQDAALTQECEAFSGVISQVQNADDGFGFYAAFGADEWERRMDAATGDAATLAASSTTTLAPHLEAMHSVLAERSPLPGGMSEVQKYWRAHQPISDICAWNHSEVYVTAEFGG